ncbi:MAG TPA: hypothetical protein VMI12_00140 [Puia sp.]|nr:hypothetical protein [Puia sp.]
MRWIRFVKAFLYNSKPFPTLFTKAMQEGFSALFEEMGYSVRSKKNKQD